MAAERRAHWVMIITGAMLVTALGLVAKVDWPLAGPAQAIPQAGVPQQELARFYAEHQIELYTLYYDFDSDGDIDIAYAVDGPIRIIENRGATPVVAETQALAR